MADAVNSVPARREIWAFRPFLIDSLPAASAEKLLKDVVFTTIPKNKYIFEEGQPADYVCIIRKGQVKLSHIDSDGRESIVMLLSERDTIWESMFLYNGTFPYSAVSMTDVQLCRIYKDNFYHILDNPEAALQIITLLSGKLHDANQRNLILAKQEPMARIAGFLMYTDERTDGEVLSLRLEDIASSVSLRTETVSRKLGILQNEGIVERVGNGRLIIKDAAALRKLFNS